MKSGKQRRAEIMKRRKKRGLAKENIKKYGSLLFPTYANQTEADHTALSHVCPCTTLPTYYTDKHFTCVRCETPSVWVAKDQKWWFETIKAYIGSRAVHCFECRKALRKEKTEQKLHMAAMALKKPHPNLVFFKKRYI